MDHPLPSASAITLRRLRDVGALAAPEAAALEKLLRQRLAWGLWIGRVLLATGAGLLCAGVIFFFAGNWAALPVAGKFALIESGLVICALLAWRAGLESLGGKIALFATCLFVGVFLAVHGQIYQTGADSWLLFAAWAALILPWVALARFPVLWVFWVVLASLALAFCAHETRRLGWLGAADLPGTLRLLGCFLALTLAAWEAGVRRGWPWMQEGWVRAVLIFSALVFLTSAAGTVIIESKRPDPFHGALAPWLMLCVAAYWFYRQVQPSLPSLTTVILSFCTVLIFALGHALRWGRQDPMAIYLLLALVAMAIFGGAVFWLRAVSRVLRARASEVRP